MDAIGAARACDRFRRDIDQQRDNVAVFVLQMQGGVLGLLMAIAAGGLVYLVVLRLTAAIPEDDVEMLSYNLGNSLPAPVVGLSLKVLQLIAPRRASQAEAP